MNAKIKKQWVAALRSGEYNQSEGRLKTEEGFCCLGVLCNLFCMSAGIKWEIDDNEEYSLFNTTGTLPIEVQEWAGIDDPNPTVNSMPYTTEGWNRPLAEINDNRIRFDVIADFIEEQL